MEDIARFLLEIGVLKNVKRSGWWMAGVKDPETVAEHSYRTAIIGYFLAKKEDELQKEKALVDKLLPQLLAEYNEAHEDIDIEIFGQASFGDSLRTRGESGATGDDEDIIVSKS